MEFRLPKLEDKEIIIDYIKEHYECGEQKMSASHMLTSMLFEDWIEKIRKNVTIPDEKWGKSYMYLAFDNDKLIGFLSVRYDLSEEMVNEYGHIGYGVRPSERRKGYANKMLAYGLKRMKELGLNKVIMACYKENIGSAKTIIKNGGKLIREDKHPLNINNIYNIDLIAQFYEIEI